MIVTCERRHLEQRARQRGYSWAEVEPCIVHWDGDSISVDTDHHAYPAKPKPRPEPQGPGTELKKLLGRVGITATEGCSCNKKAAVMDFHGCQWVRNNLDLVVGWLREEAEKRGLPFMALLARQLVLCAVRKAEKQRFTQEGAGHK